MKRIFLLSISLLIIFSSQWAQNPVSRKDANSKALKYFKSSLGNQQEGQLDKALRNLEKAIEAEPGFLDALEDAGDISHDLGLFEKAKEYYQVIITIQSDYPEMIDYKYGVVCFRNRDFKNAVTAFENYLKKESPENRGVEKAKKYLRDSKFSAIAINNPVPFNPQKMGPAINTEASEYLPSISVDGKTFIFTRFQNGDENFYFSTKSDTGWTNAKALESLNTTMNEASQSVSADGRLFVFTACNRKEGQGSCDIFFTEQMPNGTWTAPKGFGPPINTKAWESLPSISADGRTLYFSSDRPGGHGGRDIWFATRNDDGSWNEPLNAGPTINTPDWEQSPFLHPDGHTLYFMSNGLPGFGDFDLFVSRKERNEWQTPQNLGHPINTQGNEGALFVDFEGEKAYFSTDIVPGEDPALLKGESVVGSFNSTRNTDIYYFDLPENLRPLPATYTRVNVVDAETGKPLLAKLEFYNLSKQSPLLEANTDEKGNFLYVLPLGEDYALHVSKTGYLFHSENFSLAEIKKLDEPFELQVKLYPVPEKTEEGKPSDPIVLKNVFFATGSAELLPASIEELNKLRKLLEEEPKLRIQINGHTDNVGSKEDNQLLSTQRAKAVYDFLIKNGIQEDRLSYKGFGETVPVADNNTETGRKQNRRTEFQVLGAGS
jgi:outer membrane protein OmpA-like peptidoglycan-associated protein